MKVKINLTKLFIGGNLGGMIHNDHIIAEDIRHARFYLKQYKNAIAERAVFDDEGVVYVLTEASLSECAPWDK